jgi:hypothetical protein
MTLSENICQYDDHYATTNLRKSKPAAEPATPKNSKPPKKTDGAKKDNQNDPWKTPPKSQKNHTIKDQKISPPDQQDDAPTDQDQTSSPPSKKDHKKDTPKDTPTNYQTNSPSDKKDQQNDTLKNQTNSSPAKKRSAKSPNSTMPVSNRFSPYVDNDKICLVTRNINEFESSEWAIGRARNFESKRYKTRLNQVVALARERRNAAKKYIEEEGIPIFMEKNHKMLLAKESAFPCTLILIHTWNLLKGVKIVIILN